MEWSSDTKNGNDDLEVYMEYGYVFVSSTSRNHVKMATFSFKFRINFQQNHHSNLQKLQLWGQHSAQLLSLLLPIWDWALRDRLKHRPHSRQVSNPDLTVHQFKFHTQIAYKPTYMTHDLCYLLFFNYWHCHKIKSHQFGNQFFGTLALHFHLRQWLSVCTVKTGTSYFGNLFPACQQMLGYVCHIWYSLWLKSLTHNHSTRAGTVRIRCVMTGMLDRN